MSFIPRESSHLEEVKASLNAGLSLLPPAGSGDPAADFLRHGREGTIVEIERELQFARSLETCDVEIKLDGDPVVNHEVDASFLGSTLNSLQSLLHSLAQVITSTATQRGTIPDRITSRFSMRVAAVYPSSFAVQLKLPEEIVSDEQSESVMDALCRMLDGNATDQELDGVMKHKRLRSHYYSLIKTISNAGATFTITPKNLEKKGTITSQQARVRLDWLDSIPSEEQAILTVRGTLVGGSISGKRFELTVDEETFRGKLSPAAIVSLKTLKFGEFVEAKLIETTDATLEEGAEPTYYAVEIARMDSPPASDSPAAPEPS
jgi:hypothetical protein